MFILWMPGGFRLTCYYYRKAYYRAFFLDPPACAVGEPRNQYAGETRLLLFQNIHRYFLYIALVFILILGYDAIHSFIWPTADGGRTFGVSVASLVLTPGTILLALYTFSCHSLRHLVGGNVDCFSCVAGGQARYKMWRGTTRLNEHHMFWAWTSLFGVTLADLYVWMVASGRITDVRICLMLITTTRDEYKVKLQDRFRRAPRVVWSTDSERWINIKRLNTTCGCRRGRGRPACRD